MIDKVDKAGVGLAAEAGAGNGAEAGAATLTNGSAVPDGEAGVVDAANGDGGADGAGGARRVAGGAVRPDVLFDGEAALAAARRLAPGLRAGASERDRHRLTPQPELEEIAASGLLGITVPKPFGGAGVSHAVLAEVMRTLAEADPAVAQTLLPHFVLVGALSGLGSPGQQSFFLPAVLAGTRFGNAVSERGTKHAWDPQSRIVPDPAGGFRLTGRKYYATGSLTAAWMAVAAKNVQDELVLAFVPTDADGLELTDDWTSFGQRATISGSAILDNVHVSADHVLPIWQAFTGPTTAGAFDQLLHTAIDVGIARNAFDDATAYVTTRSRVWFESGADRAAEEPGVILRAGQLAVRLYAAEALLRSAAATLDETAAAPLTDDSTARASIAVASAKALAGEVSVELASALFELAGTSATDDQYNLGRHWRNARTHSVHDPVRWKYHHIGNYVLNGVNPPRHPLI
jgi:SfnB family sulfur acquisition oxidoreductase